MASNITSRYPKNVVGRSPFLNLREEFDDLLSRFTGNSNNPERWLSSNFAPPLDLSETPQAYEVRLDLPGMDPKEIDIEVDGNVVTVRGHRKTETEDKTKTYHCVERSYGSFSRSFTVPVNLDAAAVSAEYNQGVLLLTLPKSEEAKPKKIAVK